MALAATCRPGVEQTVPLHADLDCISHDSDLTAKIMRKRQEEAQRRAKLLDPRKRMFGVDPAVLDEQVAEKRAVAEAQAAEEAMYTQQQLLQEQVLQTVEDIKLAATRERQKAAVDFSLTHLRKEQRREFALSDRTAIRREQPPGASNELLGPCAMQHFEGDHLSSSERKKELQQMQAQWLREQMREKEERQRAERELDRRLDEKAALANQIRACCELAELEEQREEKRAEAETNRELAEAVRARRQAHRQREAALKTRHAETVVANDITNQLQDWRFGHDGRLVRTDYKRLTVEEEQDVYNTNAKLVLRQIAKKHEEAAEEAAQADQVLGVVSVLSAVEAEKQRQQQERRQKQDEFNAQLAKAKRELDARERRSRLAFD